MNSPASAPKNEYIHYTCSPDSFRPRTRHAVRWLNPYTDYELASAYWDLRPDNHLSRETWLEAHEMGYSYAAVVEEGKIIATAAVWRYSEEAWELAAVSTLDPASRRKGYAKSVCSFVTKYILETHHVATVSAGADNIAMQRTAESIGYRRAD